MVAFSSSEVPASYIFFELVCPTLGCFIATAMFAAPISDLRHALQHRQSLGGGGRGGLNPRPWAVMTGNCFGWIVYGYYQHNPFLLASNIPGLALSMWLNMGASQLEYHQACLAHKAYQLRQRHDQNPHRPTPPLFNNNTHDQDDIEDDGDDPTTREIAGYQNILPPLPPIVTNQQVWWFRVVGFWICLVLWVGWISPHWPLSAANQIGIAVNLNLVFFYGVPLQTIQTVVATRNSESIHFGSMTMALANATFWWLYGVALWDFVLILPNTMGIFLGLVQWILCLVFPRHITATTNNAGGGGDISLSPMTKHHGVGGLFRDLDVNDGTAGVDDSVGDQVID